MGVLPSADDRLALAPAWDALAAHYATGLEHVNAAPTRSADPGKLGGAILVDLATAAKDHPDILERYLPDRCRLAHRRRLLGPPCRVLDRRHVCFTSRRA